MSISVATPAPQTTSTAPAAAASASAQSSGGKVQPTLPANAAQQAQTNSASAANVGQTASPATSAQTINAKALLTLIQTLGKPMPGVVLPAGSQGAGTGTLPLQMNAPTHSASNPSAAPAQTLAGARAGASVTALIPLPTGSSAPAAGTAVMVQAEGNGTHQQLSITVHGKPQVTADSLRLDASRQGSLAPLMADLAALSSSGSPTNALGSQGSAASRAIGQMLGFVLNGDQDISPDMLRNAMEGARGTSPSSVNTSSAGTSGSGALGSGGSPSAGGSPAPMQTALGALARAIGLSLPSTGANTGANPGANPGANFGATMAAPSAQQGQNAGSPPQGGSSQPSRLDAAPLPLDAPDLSDPAVLQALKSKTEAGLSRLNLMQAASDGAAQTATRGGESATVLRWDVPMMVGQEAALLGVVVERDGGQNKGRDEQAQTWRFRFAFSSRQHGEIDGMVALHTRGLYDERPGLDIAVWAGDESVRDQLERSRVALISTLEGLGLGVDSLSLKGERSDPQPSAEQERSQHLLDIAS